MFSLDLKTHIPNHIYLVSHRHSKISMTATELTHFSKTLLFQSSIVSLVVQFRNLELPFILCTVTHYTQFMHFPHIVFKVYFILFCFSPSTATSLIHIVNVCCLVFSTSLLFDFSALYLLSSNTVSTNQPSKSFSKHKSNHDTPLLNTVHCNWNKIHIPHHGKCGSPWLASAYFLIFFLSHAPLCSPCFRHFGLLSVPRRDDTIFSSQSLVMSCSL